MLNSESEFQIIERYFKNKKSNSTRIIKGIGDDAAVIDVSNQTNLVVSMDTLLSGVHFPKNTDAYDIGIKSLAVNLSDLAAMGATPAWFTLALTLPETNTNWLKEFSRGLLDSAEQYNIELIGGDTTRGPLSITIQVAGSVRDGNIMYRSGAHVNDDIYISGFLGDAGAGLQLVLQHAENNDSNAYLVDRLNKPTPRVLLGEQLRHYANACIDISDGLLADLSHITELSGCGASINIDSLPLSIELKANQDLESCFQLALNSGDDYELCFTAATKYSTNIEEIAGRNKIPVTKIGKITKETGIHCYLNNKPYEVNLNGYEHFKIQ